MSIIHNTTEGIQQSSYVKDSSSYPRDLIGYGPNPPNPNWPNGAKIAVQFVLNYEEGGENTILNGDLGSETHLTETPGNPSQIGVRDLSTESCFEYGSRAGVYRVLNAFKERGYHLTVYAVGKALELNPEIGRIFVEGGHEVASHHYRWINYANTNEYAERDQIRKAVEVIKNTTGSAPVGWYTGRQSGHHRQILLEEFDKLGLQLKYDSDAYNDDLPYYVQVNNKPHLVIPYTLDVNDMKFGNYPGISTADDYFAVLKSAFDTLYEEGEKGSPKMFSVGMHCRIIGRPGRFQGLKKFLDYISTFDGVWVAKREEIADHWLKTFPAKN